MAKPELGAKRQCQSCATKFYDLNKDPILCPKCGAVFHVAAISRAPARDEEEDSEIEKESADTVSLDEVEEAENAAEAIDVDEDVELDDDADDDTFLEEEEGEDDDVAGLIDGDIETDEES
ncbi:TIGR02300 family protein [Methylocystis sp. WRRC1]|uniref:TIGR02300 family protein n=1 Tax=unclassified Methylocystis TaxID=2625913 RepID=UPI0001F879BA|nr:TIGR02300 family protein [Methylocystis sp. ATCC 49242]MCC3245809.1 TIGR02300 family protein [Methylocystis sp. WRRC1]